jgi:hypothetical protein
MMMFQQQMINHQSNVQNLEFDHTSPTLSGIADSFVLAQMNKNNAILAERKQG